MSKAVMLAGGMWKLDISLFIAAPCSTNRERTCTNTIEAKMVQSHIGSSRNTHLTSSTCVTVQRRHGLGFWRVLVNRIASSGVKTAARSRNLFLKSISSVR